MDAIKEFCKFKHRSVIYYQSSSTIVNTGQFHQEDLMQERRCLNRTEAENKMKGKSKQPERIRNCGKAKIVLKRRSIEEDQETEEKAMY